MQQEINALELYCAYSKCKVYNEGLGKLYDKIDTIDIGAACLGLRNLGDEAPTYHIATNCKLALKPLIAITDDHLEMIDRIAFGNGKHKADKLERIDRSNPIVSNALQIFDTLRLLGYDCGYMHIPSLIEDGRFAIDITK